MSTATNQHTLPAGYKLLWYEIKDVLGQGGFGITYLAHDTNLDQPVAIKEYMASGFSTRTPDSTVTPISESHEEQFAWGLSRFVSEGQTLARFDHSSIVRVYSVFEANNTAYMVMRYEDGQPLDRILKERITLPESELLALLMPIIEGLEQVHAGGFIHRDIKPANIYIRENGTPVLLDFGSARQALSEHTQTLTSMVSPGYAPFEQYYSSSSTQGPWTDIYALAATLYRAVTGTSPMAAVDRSKTILSGAGDFLVTAGEQNLANYSANFLNAIDHGLAFREQDRPQDLGIWRAEIMDGTAPVEVGTPQPTFTATNSQTVTASALASAEDLDAEALTTVADEPALDTEAATVQIPAGGHLRPGWQRHPLLVAVTCSLLALVLLGLVSEESTTASKSQAGSKLQSESRPLTNQLPDPVDALLPEMSNDTALEDLLDKARDDVEALRLTSPIGNNAWEKYQRVLIDDPQNRQAQQGLDTIAERYLELARQAANREEFQRANGYLDSARSVSPDNPGIEVVRAYIANAQMLASRPKTDAAQAQAEVEPASERENPASEQRPSPRNTLASMKQARKAMQRGDFEKAAQILEPLAAQGNKHAQYQLAGLYATGRGVDRDLGRAYALLSKAAAQGLPSAKRDLQKLKRNAAGLKDVDGLFDALGGVLGRK